MYARTLAALVGLVAACLCLAPQADAAIDKRINFQGRLTDASGVPVPNGTYNLEFKLHNHATSTGGAQGVCSGSCLWMETRTGGNRVQVTNGHFTVQLGEVTTLDAFNFDQTTLHLSVQFGGTAAGPTWDGEMTPRNRLGAAPTAIHADRAANSTQLNGQAASFYTSATNIGSGTLADGRLSSNVALKNANNNFSASQTITGQSILPTTGSGGGLVVGGDTNLYRSAADKLRTDDDFLVGGTLDSSGVFIGGSIDDLVPNGSLETNLTGWNSNCCGAPFIWQRTSTWSSVGTWSGQYQTNSNLSGFVNTNTGTAGIPVNPNTSYIANATINVTSSLANGVQIRIRWYNAAGTLVSSDTSSDYLGAGIKEVRVNATSPATAAFAAIDLGTVNVGPSGTINFRFDGVTLSDTFSCNGCVSSGDLAVGLGMPVGSILPFWGTVLPSGYLWANGTVVSCTAYPALCAAQGASGTVTLPDLRGRVPAGVDGGAGRISTNNTFGATAGAQTHTLTVGEMPSHSHQNYVGWGAGAGSYPYWDGLGGRALYGMATSDGATGGGGAHNNLQPYQAVNYMVRAA